MLQVTVRLVRPNASGPSNGGNGGAAAAAVPQQQQHQQRGGVARGSYGGAGFGGFGGGFPPLDSAGAPTPLRLPFSLFLLFYCGRLLSQQTL